MFRVVFSESPSHLRDMDRVWHESIEKAQFWARYFYASNKFGFVGIQHGPGGEVERWAHESAT